MIADEIDHLAPEQLRQVLGAASAEAEVRDELLQRREREVTFKQPVMDKLTHENAFLKQLKSAAQSEAFNPEQKPAGGDARRPPGRGGCRDLGTRAWQARE